MQKINVAVIFGGKSSEHDISRLSVMTFVRNISVEKYNLFIIGITKNGEWYLYGGDKEKIIDGSWELDKQKRKVLISPDSSDQGLIVFNDDKSFEKVKIDVAIPVMHGETGEDGNIQGLLKMSSIPFVGCDVCASVLCMDKAVNAILLSSMGIKKPKFFWFRYRDFIKHKEVFLDRIESKLGGYPFFVKPSNSGSSIGISKAIDRESLIKSIDIAKDEDEKILVEEMIEGQEVECAVIGNENPTVSVVGEINSGAVFYDYDAKYVNKSASIYIPARIPKDISEQVRSMALAAYKIVGGQGLARIDFFVQKGTNEVLLNEINTFPGFTEISMYPKLMEYDGIGIQDLMDRLIKLAIEKKK